MVWQGALIISAQIEQEEGILRLMLKLESSSEPIRLKLAKQLFRDGWLLTIDKNEYGEIRFGSLRLKASGKSAEAEYELKKEGKRFTVLREGQVIASYEGQESGSGSLVDGEAFTIDAEMKSTMPGFGEARLVGGSGKRIVWTETTWNALGVPHCDLVVEPGAPTGDKLWGAILILLRIVVEHGLWNVSKDAAAKAFLFTSSLRG